MKKLIARLVLVLATLVCLLGLVASTLPANSGIWDNRPAWLTTGTALVSLAACAAIWTMLFVQWKQRSDEEDARIRAGGLLGATRAK